MKIIIVGAGQVGQAVAKQLVGLRHLVTIVDRDPVLARQLNDRIDAMVLEGKGGVASSLERAGIRDADLILAVTSSDEANVMACMVATHYGVKTKIARIRDPDYVHDLRGIHRKRVPIDLVINPEQVTATEIGNVLRIPVARYVAEFAEGRLKLVGFRAREDTPIVSLPLEELRAMFGGQGFIVCAVARGDQVIVPRGNVIIQPEDDVYVMVHRDSVNLVNVLGGATEDERLRKALILGGGRIGVSLARDLEDEGVNVTLIEIDAARCERLTLQLRRMTVVQGDGTDMELLTEAGIDTADAFVATSDDDETNILASLQVRQRGCRKVAAVVRKAQYARLITANAMIDTAINPNTVTADAITRYVREGWVTSVSSLGSLRATVVEYVAEQGSKVTGYSLKELSLPSGCVIAAIMTGNRVFTPSGDDVIEEGYRVVVAVHQSAQEAVDRMFGKRGLFG